MRPATCPNTALADALGKGATVIGPTGRNVTRPVRAAFHRLLPALGGDRAAAAAQAVQVALGEQREVQS